MGDRAKHPARPGEILAPLAQSPQVDLAELVGLLNRAELLGFDRHRVLTALAIPADIRDALARQQTETGHPATPDPTDGSRLRPGRNERG